MPGTTVATVPVVTWTKRTALLCAAFAAAAAAGPVGAAQAITKATMQKKIASALLHAGASSGALVNDLTGNETLYAARADLARVPASVEKLYTTSTALGRFGAKARFTTVLLRSGPIDQAGRLYGDLILRGGGDPTLSSSDITALAAAASKAGIKRIDGAVVGDETAFDKRRGGPASGWSVDGYIGGSLGALVVNRGAGANPGLTGARALARALRRLAITSTRATRTGATPATATPLKTVRSPAVSELIAMTNVPSDNFLAEMLIKNLGARFGGAGSTTAGAGVVRSYLRRFGLRPQISDGSGLSRRNRTSPRQVVGLLAAIHNSPLQSVFEDSLAVAGRSGTLARRMNGSAAEGACRGKTGTLSDVSGLAGVCRAANGHIIVFSILMNSVSPASARRLQDRAVEAIARYSD